MLTYKERMRIQFGNWKWWLTFPFMLLSALVASIFIISAALVSVVGLLLESLAVAVAMMMLLIGRWRNRNYPQLPQPREFRHKGMFIKDFTYNP